MALDAEEVFGILAKKAEGAAIYAEQARNHATTAAEILEDVENVAESIPEDYSEMSDKVNEISQSLNSKMEYFKVTATGAEDNLTIRHDGVAMTYEQLKDIYLNDKYFLYAEHYDLTLIPSLPPLDYDPILEFICTWMYQGETRISRLIINSENHAKFETVVVNTEDIVKYSANPLYCGKWIDNKSIYRRVYTVTENIAKGNTIKVADKPDNMDLLVKGFAISVGSDSVKHSMTNSDITVYVSDDGVFAINNFTGYAEKLYVVIEYTVNNSV